MTFQHNNPALKPLSEADYYSDPLLNTFNSDDAWLAFIRAHTSVQLLTEVPPSITHTLAELRKHLDDKSPDLIADAVIHRIPDVPGFDKVKDELKQRLCSA